MDDGRKKSSRVAKGQVDIPDAVLVGPHISNWDAGLEYGKLAAPSVSPYRDQQHRDAVMLFPAPVTCSKPRAGSDLSTATKQP